MCVRQYRWIAYLISDSQNYVRELIAGSLCIHIGCMKYCSMCGWEAVRLDRPNVDTVSRLLALCRHLAFFKQPVGNSCYYIKIRSWAVLFTIRNLGSFFCAVFAGPGTGPGLSWALSQLETLGGPCSPCSVTWAMPVWEGMAVEVWMVSPLGTPDGNGSCAWFPWSCSQRFPDSAPQVLSRDLCCPHLSHTPPPKRMWERNPCYFQS